MDSNTTRPDNGSAVNIPNKKMEKNLKLWQAVISVIVLVITVGTLIVNQSNKIETQSVEIKYLKDADKDKALQIKDLNQQLNQSYKEINEKLTDIMVMLQNKENKK